VTWTVAFAERDPDVDADTLSTVLKAVEYESAAGTGASGTGLMVTSMSSLVDSFTPPFAVPPLSVTHTEIVALPLAFAFGVKLMGVGALL
jgi:hypothetical protein